MEGGVAVALTTALLIVLAVGLAVTAVIIIIIGRKEE